MKKLPETSWAIVLTSHEHEFYFNLDSKESVWDMPDELGDVIAHLINEAMGIGNEEDEIMAERGEGEEEGSAQKRKAEDEEEPHQEEGGAKRQRTDGAGELGVPVVPKEVELTAEQRAEKFKALLRETDVSPYSMWEKELPKFINDTRYTLIKTVKERKELFEEYCTVRAAELREEKQKSAKNPKETYLKLLEEEVTQRTFWEDFARKFKRDSRFTGLSDSKEREKLFREHVDGFKKRDANRKREQNKSARDDFLKLLEETRGIRPDSRWREIKRDIERDRRYDAIRSSTEREELFEEFVRKLAKQDDEGRAQADAERKARERKAREEASLRERAEQVQRERAALRKELGSHRSQLNRADAGGTFRALLIDVVRNDDVAFRDALAELERDSRYQQCRGLSTHEKGAIFEEHLDSLRGKRLSSFHAAIDASTSLIDTWDECKDILLTDPRVTRVLDSRAIGGEEGARRLFSRYQTERKERAREELEKGLRENTFVRFHVKNAVQNCHVQAVEKGLKEGAPVGDEWRLISFEEVHEVLKEDKRWLQFAAFEEERERMLKAYLADLITRFRNERGGTMDRTIAEHAK
ncbi:transcription elongation regulator [Rhizophlyctis rosea]|uniref:Transcription elongation regulator n=1 Tax=Rhizophlyctis rosea TaxID=64517 RepID=A0AAD5X0I4_9FUNG|nr:transcription elongation regulator [Rhizophlyctis rosea]